MPVESPRVVLAIWQAVDAFHQKLTSAGELVMAPSSKDEDVAPLMAGAEVIVTGRFSKAMAEASQGLRLIQTPGAGLNGIDFAAVPEGVTVCNVYGHERGIAEYAFMTMSALNRDLFGLDRRIRGGDWRDFLGHPGRELQGRTVAIVGLGRIGSEIARWASFMRMRAVAVTRTPDPAKAAELGLARIAGMDELNSILAEADFVVLSVPLDALTRGLIGRDELAAMKPSAFLINVARGEVIDETAFYEALRDRTIAGAANDVWYQYPEKDELRLPSSLPFHELDNLILTPHIAGATDATFYYRWGVINDNIARLATGAPFENQVHPSR